ncbi:MAG: DNA-directed DNA polymerase I [Candidatus Bathyarchaeia archaeon]
MICSLDFYMEKSTGGVKSQSFISERESDGFFGYLVEVGYDGEKKSAFIKFYEPDQRKIILWYDKTGHLPYCYVKEDLDAVKSNEAIMTHPGLERLESTVKFDALRDVEVELTRIVAKDPLSIGGKPSGSMRDLVKAWEADIKYVENYIYDLNLKPGLPYIVKEDSIVESGFKILEEVERAVQELIQEKEDEYVNLALNWLNLLECPIPWYLRAALDIEVYSDVASRVPDPREAEYPVICVSVVGNDSRSHVYLLEREGMEKEYLPAFDSTVQFYSDEKLLLADVFKKIEEYPFLITFNGDDFDLRYLYHRAERLNIPKETVPIELSKDSASLRRGVHIDLYKFFFNKSIQVYAFSQKYRENTLDEVALSIIEEGKIQPQKPISELSYRELTEYCLNDAELTLKLTTFNDDLVMKLITMLARISYMGLGDVSRQGVSSWIKSMLYKAHRERNMLIPRSDDILSLKGITTTQAIIKGKKYKGAIVVEPVQGVHFKVYVLDFASLYPSIIKVWNLGYETVICPHDDPACKGNLVPGTPLWVCKRNRALESLLIGTLRDLRVEWYKPRSKDPHIPDEKRKLYQVVQNALKVVLNASYGVFGAETFPLYCPPVAESTAAIGRYVITKTIEKARSLGVSVIYGDTDSIFLGNPEREQLEKLVKWSRDELGLELEVDKEYRYVALSSRKKNYLGVYPDGNVDVKGLTGKKRHIPIFLKEAFSQLIGILSQVQSREDFENAIEKIKGIVRKCYLDLKARRIPMEDLAFNVMISKTIEGYVKTTPQHVKAAQLLKDRGYEVKPGDLISFVKVVSDPGVKPVQLAVKEEIDVAKYLEYFNSTFEQVLDALGVDMEELMGGTRLETFFNC